MTGPLPPGITVETISDPERTVRDRLAYWQGVLGLAHWRIEWDPDETPSAERVGEMRVSEAYEHAVLALGSWRAWDPRKLDEMLVHELLHLVMHDAMRVVDSDLDGIIHPDAWNVVKATHEHAIERAIERLAWTIVALGADTS